MENADGSCVWYVVSEPLSIGSTGADSICSVYIYNISLFQSLLTGFLFKLCWHRGILLDKHQLSHSHLLVNILSDIFVNLKLCCCLFFPLPTHWVSLKTVIFIYLFLCVHVFQVYPIVSCGSTNHTPLSQLWNHRCHQIRSSTSLSLLFKLHYHNLAMRHTDCIT